ncbi:hypothetical protein [Streptomyces katrae]|uniref:hypothetical protein n=1 Tax=Streptomyces katrae TaxID=68223 RepID=UPI000A9367D7|nr:hypothetical protein [Streptomyces katrae]
MSSKITARTEPLATSPRVTAGVIAQHAVPDLQQALNCTGIAAAVYAAGVNETRDGRYEGMVHIALAASDASDFTRWVKAHTAAVSSESLSHHPQEGRCAS